MRMIEMRKVPVFLVIILLFLNTVNLWIASKSTLSIIWESPLTSASQLLALMGVVLMSVTLVLSTKMKLIENLLGGLANVYKIHHIAGSAAFIFLLNHPLFLATQVLPQTKIAALYLFPSSNTAYNFGIAGLYLMILAFICMVFMKLSYKAWKSTHKLLGPAFILASVHVLLAKSDVSYFFPLRIWIGFFILLGIVSAIYTLFFIKDFRK